jgi:hypothetical protein
MPFPLRKRKSVVRKSSVPLPLRQPSNRLSRSPTRMQTRSLSAIRTRIARCNQPTTITKKRTTTESISPSSTPSTKRSKTEQNTNEYDGINKFLNLSSQKINDELGDNLQRKLHDMPIFIDNLYRILSEFMIKKCKIELTRDEKLQPYEKSIIVLLKFIHNQSSIFQNNFIQKLNQTFAYEIQQKPMSNDRIKILK